MEDLMQKITPCLFYDDNAEEAANFYVSLGLPESRIDKVQRSVADTPGPKAGDVLLVEFTLAGQHYMALNGGVKFEYTPAVSLSVDCADQAEVDRLWTKLADGGKPIQCGWISDRYGLAWQIVPSILPKLLADPDKAKAARVMKAMMQMVKIDVAALERAAAGA
jgi:predicted 3-demethylubiquinone-9 3-methyltransferase (glyoxalase superfamily)